LRIEGGIRPGVAAGEAGGDVKGQQAFADAGVADEERNAFACDAVGPELAELVGFDFAEAMGAGYAGGAGEIGRGECGIVIGRTAPSWRTPRDPKFNLPRSVRPDGGRSKPALRHLRSRR
jgi:hypothetical protein